MVTAREVDPFRETYWNLLQVIAWIATGDRTLVVKCSDQVTDYGSHWREVTLPDGRKELAECPSDRPGLLQISLTAAYKGAGTTSGSPQAERQFLDALAQEHIEVWGLANGEGSHRKIPPVEATELAISEDRQRGSGVCLRPRDPLRPGANTWTNVRLKREGVLSVWPDPLARGEVTSRRPMTKRTAPKYAAAWIAGERAADRIPSKDGLTRAATGEGMVGGRNFLRKAFDEIEGESKAGRKPKGRGNSPK